MMILKANLFPNIKCMSAGYSHRGDLLPILSHVQGQERRDNKEYRKEQEVVRDRKRRQE